MTSRGSSTASPRKYSDRSVWTPIAEGEKLATEADADKNGMIVVAVEGGEPFLVPFANVPSYTNQGDDGQAFWANPVSLGKDAPKSAEEKKAEEDAKAREDEGKKAAAEAAKNKKG